MLATKLRIRSPKIDGNFYTHSKSIRDEKQRPNILAHLNKVHNLFGGCELMSLQLLVPCDLWDERHF